MKAVIDTKSFVDAVSWVTKSYDAKNDRAYVALFIDENGDAYLSHSNLNSYMKSEFTVVSVDFSEDEDTDTQFAVDGKYIQRLANAISSSGQITISKKLSSDRTSLDVKTPSGKFTIPLLDSKIPASPKTVSIGEVDDNEFFDSLLRISKLCDPANTGSNSFIGSVDLGFDIDEDTVKLFATDRYAMGEITLGFTPENVDDEDVKEFVDDHILLPHSSAILVPPTKGINTSITLIGENDSNGGLRFGYSFPDGRVALFSLMNAAKFPHTEAMKNKTKKSVEHSITVPTSELTNAIRVVSSLAWDEDDIYLIINKDGLTVSDSNGTNKLSVAHSEIDYDLDTDYRARFVRPIINEAFSPVSTPYVSLKWGESSSAFVLTPITEDGKEVDTIFVMAVIGRMN